MIEIKAKISNISKDLLSDEVMLTLTFKGNPSDLQLLMDKDLRVSLKQWKEKRSLDANSYFWVLLDKLALLLNKSKTELYRSYIKNIGGVSDTVCVTNKAVDDLCKAWESKGIGWQTDRIESKIEGCTNVVLYYGSSVYDSAQMSRLLDLVIQDCEEQGIPTITARELEEIKARWGDEV